MADAPGADGAIEPIDIFLAEIAVGAVDLAVERRLAAGALKRANTSRERQNTKQGNSKRSQYPESKNGE
jgi:hypothetical protein